jgi:hypothetical protein
LEGQIKILNENVTVIYARTEHTPPSGWIVHGYSIVQFVQNNETKPPTQYGQPEE